MAGEERVERRLWGRRHEAVLDYCVVKGLKRKRRDEQGKEATNVFFRALWSGVERRGRMGGVRGIVSLRNGKEEEEET